MGSSSNNDNHKSTIIIGEKGNSKKAFITSSIKSNKTSNISEYEPEISSDFIQNMLYGHNRYRINHNSNTLQIKEELNQRAGKYARDLLISQSLIDNDDYYIIYKEDILGENIFIADNKENEENILKNWYSEKNKYNYDLNTFQPDTNHFTQMIWKDTKEVGFGYFFNEINKKFCCVALYYPAGNIFGKFTENVLPKEPKQKND